MKSPRSFIGAAQSDLENKSEFTGYVNFADGLTLAGRHKLFLLVSLRPACFGSSWLPRHKEFQHDPDGHPGSNRGEKRIWRIHVLQTCVEIGAEDGT